MGYAGNFGDKWAAVIDGKEGKLYDGLGEFGIQFSPDSQRVAYMGARGTKRVVVLRAPSSQPAPPAGERGARASRSTIEERESEPYENVGAVEGAFDLRLPLQGGFDRVVCDEAGERESIELAR